LSALEKAAVARDDENLSTTAKRIHQQEQQRDEEEDYKQTEWKGGGMKVGCVVVSR